MTSLPAVTRSPFNPAVLALFLFFCPLSRFVFHSAHSLCLPHPPPRYAASLMLSSVLLAHVQSTTFSACSGLVQMPLFSRQFQFETIPKFWSRVASIVEQWECPSRCKPVPLTRRKPVNFMAGPCAGCFPSACFWFPPTNQSHPRRGSLV